MERKENLQVVEDGSVRQEAGDELNSIRARTFNRELSDLVDRIYTHESSHRDQCDFGERPSDENILYDLHDLFYKSTSLLYHRPSRNDCDPAECGAGESDVLLRRIGSALLEIAHPRHSLLSFDFRAQCFRPVAGTLRGIDPDNAVIDYTEPLYRDIVDSATGIIVSPEDLRRDPMLEKRLTTSLPDGGALYFVSVKHLFIWLNREVFPRDISYAYLWFPASILMIQLDPTASAGTKRLFSAIAERCALELVLFDQMTVERLRSLDPSDTVTVRSLQEYLHHYMSRVGGSPIYSVRFFEPRSIETVFLRKYFMSKLNTIASLQTVVLNLLDDRIVIYPGVNELEAIDELVADVTHDGALAEVQLIGTGNHPSPGPMRSNAS